MCPPNSSAEPSQHVPAWRLEERIDSWRLSVATQSAHDVEVNASQIRLQTHAHVEPTVITVPKHALPVDPDAASCRFSRKRCEVVVSWPRRCAVASIDPLHDTAKSPASDLTQPQTLRSEKASCAPAQGKADADEPAHATPDAKETIESTTAAVNASEAVADECTIKGPAAPIADAQGQAHDVADQGASAEAQASVAEEVETLTSEEWRLRGNEATKAGDFIEAVNCYSAGLAVKGADEAILRSNRALCLHKVGRLEEALDDARLCVALKPDFFKGWMRGAMVLRDLGRPEEALAFLKRCPANDEAGALVSKLRPEAEAAARARISALKGPERCKEEGNVLFRKGLFEQALAKYSEALELCDDSEGQLALTLRNNRAGCSHQLSDYSAVIRDASFVLEREPTNMKALVRRMLALEPLEKYEKALQDARAVLLQDPSCEVANKMQHRLGKVVRDLQNSGSA